MTESYQTLGESSKVPTRENNYRADVVSVIGHNISMFRIPSWNRNLRGVLLGCRACSANEILNGGHLVRSSNPSKRSFRRKFTFFGITDTPLQKMVRTFEPLRCFPIAQRLFGHYPVGQESHVGVSYWRLIFMSFRRFDKRRQCGTATPRR
jgi:hypothetical protein